ncbi:MAG TPA: transposase [Candidatus Sulfotelmatobacter sp.]|nr:transposase [Candidatus Sulfotelmatobacter sp.]
MPTPPALLRFVLHRLGLQRYLAKPGDGRPQPIIAARVLLWAMLVGRILREISFYGMEQIVRVAGCRVLGLEQSFSNDTLSYFVERLDPATSRAALLEVMRHAKRGKAFQDCRFIGLALDGTGAGRSQQSHCAWCRPIRDAKHKVIGYHHKLVTISVVGTGLTLPFDVEPYGPGDSEIAAAERLLVRAMGSLGTRFADYLVGDGAYAGAPFLHAANRLGLRVVVRLKENLPLLLQAVQRRFQQQAPTHVYRDGQDRVQIWDADDFDPWESLQWKTVRVIRYRQHKPNGQVVEAAWLTDFPLRQVGSLSLYHMAKSRWEIENQGFNDAKNRYGFEHTCHHEQNSVLLNYLLTLLALTIERLYRIRFLHRGTHTVRSAEQLCRILWVALSRPLAPDTS